MARKPKIPSIPSMPSASGKSGTSSTVKNVSNSGQMSTSSHSTGATGAAINTTNISYTGPAGTPGSPSNVNAQITSTPGMGVGSNGSYTLNFPSSGVDMGEAARSAFAQAEGGLAQARAKALGAVPREYHDRVNEHFDRASTQISEHRKKMGY